MSEAAPPGEGASLSLAAAQQVNALCNRFEAAWRAGQRPRIEDALAEAAEAERAALLQELLALEVYYRRRHGEDPRPDDYRARFPALDPTWLAAAVAAPAADVQPERLLGDYRIVREVGRGGMGVVYEARQVSLGRRVALKVLPFAAALDARQLQRFKNEAQAAACLHHTNIVPVYAVGCERGVHYYAMQFIDGQTLDALIQEMRQRVRAPGRQGLAPTQVGAPDVQPTERHEPPPRSDGAPAAETDAEGAAPSTERPVTNAAYFRTVAGLGVQAAAALEHAHQLGVVHRDVKPSNLMVEARGNLWVADFGLAHFQSQPGLTLSGDLVGTLRYMSPEQALAKRGGVDHRTDVYSLGATLYELLTLRPAFPAEDRQELLRQIAHDEPRPPRRSNRAIPAELETIVAKAMGKNPDERYATAQELADDLQRFLDDKPIRARRPTVRQRLMRWTRRHRPVVWAATVCLAVVAIVLASSTGWAVRDRAAREAEAARVKAAREAETDREVDRALQEAALLRDHGDWAKARAAIQRAEWLLAAGASDANRQRVSAMRADLRMVERLEEIRLGDPQMTLYVLDRGSQDAVYAEAFKGYGIDVPALDAATAAERIGASAIRVQLVAALDDWMWAKLCRTFTQVFAAKNITQQLKIAAEYQHLRAVADLAVPNEWCRRIRDPEVQKDQRALEELADRPEVADLPPSAAMLLARLLSKAERNKAVKLLNALQQRSPDDFLVNYELAVVLSLNDARLGEAIGFMRAAAALRPQHPNLHLKLGRMLSKAQRLDQAVAAYRKAFEVEPNNAYAYADLAEALAKQGKSDEALAVYVRYVAANPEKSAAQHALGQAYRRARQWDKAIAALQQAVRLAPNNAPYHGELGQAYRHTRQWDKAIAEFREASRLAPNDATFHGELAWLLATCPDLDLRDAPQAVERARKSVEIVRQSGPGWKGLGVASYRAEDLEGAIAALEEANRLLNGGRSFEWFFLAMAHWKLDHKDEARQWYDRAVQWMKDNQTWMEDHPVEKDELDRFRAEAAKLLGIVDSPSPAANEVPPKKP